MGLIIGEIAAVIGIAIVIGIGISSGAKRKNKKDSLDAGVKEKEIELRLERERRLAHRQKLIEKAIDSGNTEALALLQENKEQE